MGDTLAEHRLPAGRETVRVRHELRRRPLLVIEAATPTPGFRRLTLRGEAMTGFASPGFDDHVKVILPVRDEAETPVMRDYTPHSVDAAAGTLQIDFALHDAGPVTDWARRARPGDPVTIGGPRGSFLIGTGFDWHLLIGDDTALSAIARRLAELPADAHAIVLAEAETPADRRSFESAASVTAHWAFRSGGDGPTRLIDLLAATELPGGAFHTWVACESADAKVLRGALLERGADPKALRAAGYWRRGAEGAHEVLD